MPDPRFASIPRWMRDAVDAADPAGFPGLLERARRDTLRGMTTRKFFVEKVTGTPVPVDHIPPGEVRLFSAQTQIPFRPDVLRFVGRSDEVGLARLLSVERRDVKRELSGEQGRGPLVLLAEPTMQIAERVTLAVRNEGRRDIKVSAVLSGSGLEDSPPHWVQTALPTEAVVETGRARAWQVDAKQYTAAKWVAPYGCDVLRMWCRSEQLEQLTVLGVTIGSRGVFASADRVRMAFLDGEVGGVFRRHMHMGQSAMLSVMNEGDAPASFTWEVELETQDVEELQRGRARRLEALFAEEDERLKASELLSRYR